MKKIIVVLGMLILATLVACGGSVDTDALVDSAADAAKDGLNAAQDAIEDGVDSAQEAIQDVTQEEVAEESGAEYVEGVNFWPQVGEGIVISTLGAENGLTLNFSDPIETGFFTPQEDDLDVRIAAGLTYSALTINPNADVQALLQWSVDEPFLQDLMAPKFTEVQGMSSQDVKLMRGDEITIDIQSVDPAEPRGALDVTFNIFRDSASVGLFSFVTSGGAAPREIALLAPALPTATPTEVPPTATPTIVPTPVEEVHPVFNELEDDVALRGSNVANDFDGGEGVIVNVGAAFEYDQSTWNRDFPEFNLTTGQQSWIVWIDPANSGANTNVLIPKFSETTLGKEANDKLAKQKYWKVTAVGAVNNPIMAEDTMEVALSDPSSSDGPYTVTFYRGDNREVVTSFTIDK